MTQRVASVSRTTRETDIRCTLSLDGHGEARVNTGLGFLDHMLTALAKHGRLNLELRAEGDLCVDDHHTVEDCALVLGEALEKALGDKAGVARFGHAYVPLDESLARAVVDLSGRPWPVVNLGLRRDRLGDVSCENLTHFMNSLALSGRFTLHVELLRGENDHHRVEAAFKALALALRQATAIQGESVPSTKGVL